MDLLQIEALLDSPNPQYRMQAITELRHHEPTAVVPLLKRRINDKEFLVRSFAAMGLGYKRTQEGFEALLDIVEHETDHNVLAETANSLAKFGPQSIPHLVTIFRKHSHWLIQQSILAALEDFNCPEILLTLCYLGFYGEDPVVKQMAIAYLARLIDTPQELEALELLITAANHNDADMRIAAARVLRHFDNDQVDNDQARTTLAKLRQDPDYRVVGAVFEGLL